MEQTDRMSQCTFLRKCACLMLMLYAGAIYIHMLCAIPSLSQSRCLPVGWLDGCWSQVFPLHTEFRRRRSRRRHCRCCCCYCCCFWLYIEHCAAVRCLHHVESYTQQNRRCRNLNCFEDPSVLLLLSGVLGTRQLHRANWFEPLRHCW